MRVISFWFTLIMCIYSEITDNTKKNTETLIDASKEVGLEVNERKLSSYTLLSRHQNAG
jgi:hypothetical protein